MNKAHANKNWEDYPSYNTALDAKNLNDMDGSIDAIDNRVIVLDTTKLDKSDAQLLVKKIEYDRQNGMFTITYFNGSTVTIDTLLEKLAVNFDFDPVTQRLIIILDDGTEKYVDLSALITQYEFVDTETIAFALTDDGKVTAIIKEGSVEEKHLRPDYLADIKVEVAKAKASQQAAAASEEKAKESENSAKESQNEAKTSEDNAAASAVSAAEYVNTAIQKATSAANSAVAAKTSETNSKTAETNAKTSETNAADSKAAAAESAQNAESYATQSKSYAIGGTGTRENENTDCSLYYSEIARQLTEEAQKLLDQAQKIIAASSSGALVPAGTVTFSALPESPKVGYMYNISNKFTTDARFVEGAGKLYNAGANVYWTKDGKWDVLAGVQVTGVKGSAESSYRTGNVNLTAANIGLGNVNNTADANKDVRYASSAGNADTLDGMSFIKCTQAEYDALGAGRPEDTIYIIVG